MEKVKHIINRGVKLSEPGYAITGFFGLVGYPLFYVIWETAGYRESLQYRTFCTFICLGLLLSSKWPQKMKRFLPYYWYFFLIVCIKAFFAYSLLLNDFNLVWLLSFTCSLYILGQFIDWMNYLIISVIGDVLAVVLYILNNGMIYAPDNFVELFIVYIFINSSCLVLNFRSMVLKMEKWATLRFISAKISHEIGTPVAAIYMISGGLVDKIQSNAGKNVILENARKIYRQSEHIKTIISIMLSNARRGQIDPNEFAAVSISDCINDAVTDYPYTKHNLIQRVRVEIKEDYLLLTNKILFINLVYNLIKNSIKALDRKGNGEISITAHTEKDWNVLTIRDTGQGIPKNIEPIIFDELTSTGDETNVGLGLNFVKSVMDAMGGKIVVNTEYGEYTEVVLLIPKIQGGP
jgi:two-component system CAI-1 autoinducer sensor kinase/phosphatase CqsS